VRPFVQSKTGGLEGRPFLLAMKLRCASAPARS
jgi:hypothetical protein